jgi:uncharacterized DUF497 family protein
VRFERDPARAAANRRKHGVPFEAARALFESGEDFLEIHDERHSMEEDRFIAVGPVAGDVLFVVFVERDEDAIRIPGARRATRREAALYRRHMRGEP